MTTDEKKTRKLREPLSLSLYDLPLYPTEPQIARAVLGDRAKDWKRVAAFLEAKYKFPPVIYLMGGRFWPAVVTFFYGWHSISLDNSRVDHTNHIHRNPRIWVVPPNAQFEDDEDKRSRQPVAKKGLPEAERLKSLYNSANPATGRKARTVGEWEAEIRLKPMWPSERKFLRLYYEARNDASPSRINGAGEEVPNRLSARGYIKQVAGSSFPIWKITPEGEAAWLVIADREGIYF